MKTSRASQTRAKAETMGYQDTKNVAASLREGYELVRADEYPE